MPLSLGLSRKFTHSIADSDPVKAVHVLGNKRETNVLQMCLIYCQKQEGAFRDCGVGH